MKEQSSTYVGSCAHLLKYQCIKACQYTRITHRRAFQYHVKSLKMPQARFSQFLLVISAVVWMSVITWSVMFVENHHFYLTSGYCVFLTYKAFRIQRKIKCASWDFPGDWVVKILLSNAGSAKFHLSGWGHWSDLSLGQKPEPKQK